MARVWLQELANNWSQQLHFHMFIRIACDLGCGHSHISKLEPFNPTIKCGPSQDSRNSLILEPVLLLGRGSKVLKPITLCLITERDLIQLSWNQVLSESQVLWQLHLLTLNLSFPETCCWTHPSTLAPQLIPKLSSWVPKMPCCSTCSELTL